MWIEGIEIENFGGISNRVVKFRRDRLNVVVEPNEFGKSTLAEAIWAVLYDYPSGRTTEDRLKGRDARKPLGGGVFKACVDIIWKDRMLRIVRDFSSRTVRVFDRGNSDVEVTNEFLSGANKDEVGAKLTGLSRELFQNTCFVGQRDLSENVLGESSRDLASVLQSLADCSGSSTTSATAIGVLDEALAKFNYDNSRGRIDRFVTELEQKQDDLKSFIQQLEAQKQSVSAELQRVEQLDIQIAEKAGHSKVEEYFELCMQEADLDGRLIKAQERLVQFGELRQQFAGVMQYENFPADREKSVEELWTRRISRQIDYARMRDELQNGERSLQEKKKQIVESWKGMSEFAYEDAQTILSLGRSMQTCLSELSDAKQKREAEKKRLIEAGIEIDGLSGVRKTLLNLDAREVDDAYAYNAQIKGSKDQIQECERAVWRARMIAQEIEEQRKTSVATWRGTMHALILFFIILACVVGAAFTMRATVGDGMFYAGVGLLIGTIIGVIAVASLISVASRTRQGDYAQAKEDEEKQSALGQELHTKIMGLEVRLEDLARKVGVSSGAELVKQIQEYGSTAAQLKELDLFEQIISSRMSQLVKLKEDLEPHFKKADRMLGQITPDDASKLASDINGYHDEMRSLDSTISLLEHKRSELQFLSEELREIEAGLKDQFSFARLAAPENLEQSYEEFGQSLVGYKRYLEIQADMDRMAQDFSGELTVENLQADIQKLQNQRDQIFNRMQQIMAEHPNVADMPIPDPGSAGILPASTSIDDLQTERNDLTVHIRAVTSQYDEKYLDTVEQLESVERDLQWLKRTKQSLELARKLFSQFSDETHSHWSSGLNQVSRDMLENLNLGFDTLSFDKEFRLTARKRGSTEPLQAANISSQLSSGTREQLHWLARMAVVRFLSNDMPLPIILDEPFCEADDERFSKMMNMLIDNVMQDHQIIVFSCHQGRHRWLMENLEEDRRDRINECRLEDLLPVGT
jgi:chromosome segregation ATPase